MHYRESASQLFISPLNCKAVKRIFKKHEAYMPKMLKTFQSIFLKVRLKKPYRQFSRPSDLLRLNCTSTLGYSEPDATVQACQRDKTNQWTSNDQFQNAVKFKLHCNVTFSMQLKWSNKEIFASTNFN